jgi:hypothetical protein
MQCYWCSITFFSFPSFPEFHRAVPLLQTCSTTEFACDHVHFCVYVFLGSIFHIWEKNMHLLYFWSWLTSLNTKSSNCIHLPSNPVSLLLWLSNTSLCSYTIISWSIHQL